MTSRAPTTFWIFATLLGASTLLPLASAVADPAPDTVNNATVSNGSTGNYDGFDQFRDATGRPLPGWEYLFYSP